MDALFGRETRDVCAGFNNDGVAASCRPTGSTFSLYRRRGQRGEWRTVERIRRIDELDVTLPPLALAVNPSERSASHSGAGM